MDKSNTEGIVKKTLIGQWPYFTGKRDSTHSELRIDSASDTVWHYPQIWQ